MRASEPINNKPPELGGPMSAFECPQLIPCAAGIGDGGPEGIAISVSSASPASNRASSASGSYITPTGIFGKCGCSHERSRLLDRADVNLELHAISIGIGVIDRQGGAMVDWPVRHDPGALQARVGVHQLAHILISVGDVVDADLSPVIARRAAG